MQKKNSDEEFYGFIILKGKTNTVEHKNMKMPIYDDNLKFIQILRLDAASGKMKKFQLA